MVARLEIFSPSTTGIDAAVLSEFTDGNLISLTELGGITNNGFENGTQSINKESKQPRLYTVQGVTTREQYALVNYYKQLQINGDASQTLTAQEGLIYCRDFYYEIDEIELLYQRVAAPGSTTTTVSNRTIRCGFQFPCYLLFGDQIKNVLGNYYGETITIAESAEFAILERVDILPSEITTAQAGTIRVEYGGFTVDFLSLPDDFVRLPNLSPEITYSIRETTNIARNLLGTRKQVWAVANAELTETQADQLDAMLSLWRQNWTPTAPNIVLTDLTRRIAEPSPATRTVVSGLTTENGTDRYFGQFGVGQASQLSITRKPGDSSKKLVSITFGEV